MGELYEPFPKLPKNIRQIGERDQVLKLYLEDYVNTYLKRLHPTGGSDLRVGLLLGNVEMHEDTPYVFVDGALEMENITEEGEKVAFTEDAWKKAYQDVEQMFPKRTVQGWFLCGSPGCNLSPLNYWRQHGQYFTGKHQLMYLNSGLEGEEAIYITSSDGFYKLRGYSIFYERNQMMQDYMILRRDTKRVETGVDDKVIRDFKKRMDERKVEAVHHKSTVGVLTGLCGVLTVTVLAGGVAMFNNYQKMQQMESVIASVVPGGSVLTGGKQVEDMSGKGWADSDSPDYVIEEARGQVYPTTAPADESRAGSGTSAGSDAGADAAQSAGRESASEVIPETMPSGSGQAGDGMQSQGGAGGQNVNAAGAQSGSQGGASTQGGASSQGTSGSQDGSGASNQNGASSQGGANSQSTSGGSGAPNASGPQTPTATTESPSATKSSESSQPTKNSESSKSGDKNSGAKDAASSQVDYKVYTVESGDTLYGICFKLYSNLGELDEIMRVNALEDENSIFAGQKLLVP